MLYVCMSVCVFVKKLLFVREKVVLIGLFIDLKVDANVCTCAYLPFILYILCQSNMLYV